MTTLDLKSFKKWTVPQLADYFRKLDPKAKIRLVGLGIGLMLFIPFVVWPAWILHPFLQLQVNELARRVYAAKVQTQQEPKMLAEKIAFEGYIQETQKRLFFKKEVEGLLGTLADLGQKSKVALLSSQPQSVSPQEIPTPHDKRYESFSYLLSLEGGYHELAAFVSEIENYPKVIRIDDFSMNPREETPGIHVAELKLSVFLKRERQ